MTGEVWYMSGNNRRSQGIQGGRGRRDQLDNYLPRTMFLECSECLRQILLQDE